MADLVIADTSCLIVLQKIGRLGVLKEIFEKIMITKEIAEEFGDKLPEWITVTNVGNEVRKRILRFDLDKDEASAIALGLENEGALILIDERKGRKVAVDLGLRIMGTLGVLIKAKETGHILSLTDEIKKLQKVEFRMSKKLVDEVLQKYG